MFFFKNHGPFKLNYLIKKTKFVINKKYSDCLISKASNLLDAKKEDITFFDNIKYLDDLKNTEASHCIINQKYLRYIPKNLIPIYSTSPLLDFILIAKTFFPESCYDANVFNILNKNELKKKIKRLSNNLIIAKNVKIGKNVSIGSNTIIKDYCIIGSGVKIGSNCVISNSIVGQDTEILDNTVIGKRGFGFKRIENKIESIPHFGKVSIGKGCFIGSCVTIDRGSFNDTVIGDHSYIDNHVHIAHNVRIGKYCFFAAQSGIAGSTKIGTNCLIGGQAGISGHLTIGDNVIIGGGSGVIKNLKNNKKVMGYPAVDFKNFVKEKRNVN